MKIRIDKADLTKAIGTVISAINPRSTLPILANILIETIDKEKIRVTGTDLEIGIICCLTAEIIEEGAITIPAKKFNDIIRETPITDIEISVTKNNSITITSGKAFFKLMGLPKEDYPKFSPYSLEKAIKIDAPTLKEAINLTCFAISSDETRYVLNGALVIIKEKEMKMIATDGRRLAFINKKITLGKNLDYECIIPTKALHELSKNTPTDGSVNIIDLGNQIVFHLGDVTIISRLIEGHFPNYEQVIPKEEKVIVIIEREKLLSTIRRVSLLTSLESQAIKVDLVKGKKMIISSRSPNIGESKEEIEVSTKENKDDSITIGFNPAYIIDVLKNIDIEKVELSLNSADKPGVIRGKEGYVYVIMPMQIG